MNGFTGLPSCFVNFPFHQSCPIFLAEVQNRAFGQAIKLQSVASGVGAFANELVGNHNPRDSARSVRPRVRR
jgi:hypothetical protein